MFDVSNIGLDTIPHLQCWTNKTIKLKIPASLSWVPTPMLCDGNGSMGPINIHKECFSHRNVTIFFSWGEKN